LLVGNFLTRTSFNLYLGIPLVRERVSGVNSPIAQCVSKFQRRSVKKFLSRYDRPKNFSE